MTAYIDPMCSTCGGRGYYYTDEGETACAGCRLAERSIEADRQRAVSEDSMEAAYKAAGYERMSPLEQRYSDGDR